MPAKVVPERTSMATRDTLLSFVRPVVCRNTNAGNKNMTVDPAKGLAGVERLGIAPEQATLFRPNPCPRQIAGVYFGADEVGALVLESSQGRSDATSPCVASIPCETRWKQTWLCTMKLSKDIRKEMKKTADLETEEASRAKKYFTQLRLDE